MSTPTQETRMPSHRSMFGDSKVETGDTSSTLVGGCIDETLNDPDIIDWDGPTDPSNPLNWPKLKRIGHVVLISVITLMV